MDSIQVAKNTYGIKEAMDDLVSKLDDSIDDIENGRVISEEEMWAELDAV